MFSYVANKIQKRHILKPVVVVDHLCGIFASFKIQKFRQLLLHAFHVMLQRFGVEQIAFLGFSGWIAHHTRGATYKSKRLVSSALKVNQRHDLNQVTNVQGVRCGIETNVPTGNLFVQRFFRSRHDVVHHSAPS